MATTTTTPDTKAPAEAATTPAPESKVKLTKKGLPDKRCNNRPPAANLSKARAALKEFISKGKQKAKPEETDDGDDEEESEEEEVKEVKEVKAIPAPIPVHTNSPSCDYSNRKNPLVPIPIPTSTAPRASSRSQVQSPKPRKSKKTKRIYLSESESESSSEESEYEMPVLYRTKSSYGGTRNHKDGRKTERIEDSKDLKNELERIRKDFDEMRIQTSQTIQKQNEDLVKQLRKTQDDAFLQAARARISIRYPSQV